jgi:hypothetical protein
MRNGEVERTTAGASTDAAVRLSGRTSTKRPCRVLPVPRRWPTSRALRQSTVRSCEAFQSLLAVDAHSHRNYPNGSSFPMPQTEQTVCPRCSADFPLVQSAALAESATPVAWKSQKLHSNPVVRVRMLALCAARPSVGVWSDAHASSCTMTMRRPHRRFASRKQKRMLARPVSGTAAFGARANAGRAGRPRPHTCITIVPFRTSLLFMSCVRLHQAERQICRIGNRGTMPAALADTFATNLLPHLGIRECRTNGCLSLLGRRALSCRIGIGCDDLGLWSGLRFPVPKGGNRGTGCNGFAEPFETVRNRLATQVRAPCG